MVTPGDLQYSFFCNSGTEANEGALKLAKLHAKRKKANHSNGIISCLGGFHGKSFGSLSVTGKAAWREPFYPLAPNVRFVPYGDADALDKELKVCDTIGLDIAAFIAEPVQGEAGALVPPDDFFPKVREICDKWGILFIADEVQTGHGPHRHAVGHRALGRGAGHHDHGQGARRRRHPRGLLHLHARGLRAAHGEPVHPHHDVRRQPDGHRRPSIAALHATLDEDIPRQAAEKGAWLMERFEELRAKYPDLLHEVRGLGLLIGLEYCSEEAGYAVATGLFGEGVLTGGTLFSAKTFRIEPPATLTQHEMDEIVAPSRPGHGPRRSSCGEIDGRRALSRSTATGEAPRRGRRSGPCGRTGRCAARRACRAAVRRARRCRPRAAPGRRSSRRRPSTRTGSARPRRRRVTMVRSETAATRSAQHRVLAQAAVLRLGAMTRRMRSPSTSPGQMALTRMPCGPSSMASVLTKPMSPHLVAT